MDRRADITAALDGRSRWVGVSQRSFLSDFAFFFFLVRFGDILLISD